MKKSVLTKTKKKLALAVVLCCSVLILPLAACSSGGAKTIELKSGKTYKIDAAVEGGSGKSSVASPAELTVKEDGKAYVRLEWSSSHYDYMKVGDEKYLPINEEGNSVFEIPVPSLAEPMTVIADTTAMSVPHEVEYTLTLDPDTIEEVFDPYTSPIFWIGAAVVVISAVRVIIANNRKGSSK